MLGLNIRGNRVISETLAKEIFIPNCTEEECDILSYIHYLAPVGAHRLVKYSVLERMEDYMQVEEVQAKFVKKKMQVEVEAPKMSGKGKKKIEEN